METSLQKNNVAFHGQGMQLLGILIVNWLLTAITLGLYYPWARAALLRYMYQETEFSGSRFTFHGTGKEMFIGFLKVIGVFIVLYGVLIAAILSQSVAFIIAAYIFFVLSIIALVPLAIYGALRYRMSRTSWRGIHFGFRGKLGDIFREYVIGAFLTIITLGIYTPWFTNTIRKRIIDNIRFGNVKFTYAGNGTDLFIMYIKGFILGILTLGIYFFWFLRDWHNYLVRNIWLEQNESKMRLESTLTTGAVFENTVVNAILIIFTLGLALPWVMIRNINLVINNLQVPEAFDAETIAQTEEDYKNAMGEDLADVMDLGLI